MSFIIVDTVEISLGSYEKYKNKTPQKTCIKKIWGSCHLTQMLPEQTEADYLPNRKKGSVLCAAPQPASSSYASDVAVVKPRLSS